MRIVFVYSDVEQSWNCSQYNCIAPAQSINKMEGYHADTIQINDFVTNSEVSQRVCQEADIIVVERNLFGDTLTMIQYWKARNKTVLAVFDDAYNLVPPSNPAYGFWSEGKVNYTTEDGKEVEGQMIPKPMEQFYWGIKMVKGVVVPSEYLQKDWFQYNPNTVHIHNALELDEYVTPVPLIKKEDFTIGWCGGSSHRTSFYDSGVMDAMRKIGKNYPDVRFLIAHDKQIFDDLKVPNKIFSPFVRKDKWKDLLKSLDIGIAPLSGEFDRRRSWIKVLEYMVVKVPWIASDYPTYSELAEYGVLTKNGYVDWEKNLTEMIENYPKYQALANKQAYEFAITQSSDDKVKKYLIPFYERMLNEKYPI